MKKLTWLLRIVGVIQITLGILYVAVPGPFLNAMGHSVPAPDVFYPLAMLAARFLAVGIVFLYISSAPYKHRLWIDAMIAIQLIDLAAGIGYTAAGIVPVTLSAMPMFNAIWIAALLFWWRPQTLADPKTASPHERSLK